MEEIISALQHIFRDYEVQIERLSRRAGRVARLSSDFHKFQEKRPSAESLFPSHIYPLIRVPIGDHPIQSMVGLLDRTMIEAGKRLCCYH